VTNIDSLNYVKVCKVEDFPIFPDNFPSPSINDDSYNFIQLNIMAESDANYTSAGGLPISLSQLNYQWSGTLPWN
jgi:hypothetical protein